MAQPRVLIVDDEPSLLEVLALGLGRDFDVSRADAIGAARAALQSAEFDLVITDLKLPDGSGLDLLAAARDLNPDARVIVLTAHGSTDSAVAAMKQGASDYLTKPFDLDELKIRAFSALDAGRMRRENRALRAQIPALASTGGILGDSPAMVALRDTIRAVAPGVSTVLIQGESGTGKELVARALHAESLRRNQAFISLNCAAVPESLLESELFGHTRGAFTDAKEARMGLFELAHQGTLFLDEIAEMPLAMQSKLLRVIQERAVRRLGGARETSVDVRILAATNRRLSDLVAEGRFRQDLFFRLNVIPILVPPLRERMGDIPELAREFCHRFARRMNRPVTGISEDAMRALRARPWPGNVRELENALERAVALETEPAIQLQRVHDDGGAGSPAREDLPSVPLPRYLDLEEKRLLLAALGRAAGDRRKAADLLGVSQRALRYLLQKHDTSRPTA